MRTLYQPLFCAVSELRVHPTARFQKLSIAYYSFGKENSFKKRSPQIKVNAIKFKYR